MGNGRIMLVLLSGIGERLAEALREGLAKTFGRRVDIEPGIQPLGYAYDNDIGQYVSPRILARLRRIKRGPDDKVLGVTDVDLYSPGFDFVFGEAEVASGVATLSIYRLKEGRPSATLLVERAVKEAVHEVAHLYRLGHCSRPRCVMRFCPSLSDVDAKGRALCAKCGRRFGKNKR